MERRRIGRVQAEKTDDRRQRGQEHRIDIGVERPRDGGVLLHPVAHAVQGGGDDVDRVRDRHGHDDDRDPGVGGAEHRPQPTRDAHRGVDDEHEQDREGDRAVQGSEKEGRGRDDDEEYHRPQDLEVVLRGVRKGAAHDHVAGHVVGDVRMLRARLIQGAVQVVGNLDHRGVLVVRQDKIDCQSPDPSVQGYETSGNFDFVEGDGFHAGEVRVAQRAGILHERLDDQVVPQCLAV